MTRLPESESTERGEQGRPAASPNMAEKDNLLSTAVHRTTTMPGNCCVRPPESPRPRLTAVLSGAHIPVVDLASPDRTAVVAAIGSACRTHGFFQVLNHGIDAGLIADVVAVPRKFFRLPAEELGFRLYAAISESLGLEAGYMKETLAIASTELEQDMDMAVNFYRPCPSPEVTYGGLPAHTADPNALTIMLMDEDVAGLQVLHDGKWVAAVNPQPGALIVGIDDDHLLQVRVEKSAGAKAGDPIIPPGTKKASGEDDGRGRGDGPRRGRGSLAAVMGIVAASSAFHAVAVGVITPVVVVGAAVVMSVGVSMVMTGFLQI